MVDVVVVGLLYGEDSHPGVVKNVLQVDPRSRSQLQALPNEIPAFVGDPVAEIELRGTYLLVLFEGDVAADHVVEEDAERPNGGAETVVAVEADPLRRGVDASACNSV